MELREFYCPLSGRLLETEAVTPGYPVVHDFRPTSRASTAAGPAGTCPSLRPYDGRPCGLNTLSRTVSITPKDTEERLGGPRGHGGRELLDAVEVRVGGGGVGPARADAQWGLRARDGGRDAVTLHDRRHGW